jgi:hypothetical protein
MRINLQKHWASRQLYCVPELVSKIIYSMQTDGTVYLHTNEGKNAANNGLYTLLDELCLYWKWNKADITIETSNFTPTSWIMDETIPNFGSSHPEYNIKRTSLNLMAAYMELTSAVLPWNKEKYYGMFIGRATSDRIFAAYEHKHFKFSSMGLTSFNDNLFEFMSYPDLVDYFMQSDQTYAEMLTVTPYSDIKELIPSPDSGLFTPPYNTSDWSRIYEKIAIEIVCETSTEPNCGDVSEKVYRPLYYKRPFLLIGSPGQMAMLHDLGFKTFNGILDESYDQLTGFARVKRVFNLLDQLISENRLGTLLDECNEILEHNHKQMIRLSATHRLRHRAELDLISAKINHND